jgi:prepilin-type N-terminal cleavage/methylation domain-containing protein
MNGRKPILSARCRMARGFTLVEVMVAMAVLSLIIVMLSQIFSTTVLATSYSQRRMEATRQARAVLDTMRQDLANLVVENGAATVFAKADGQNSKLVFVTYRRGPLGATEPRFMSISYSLDGTQMQVTRSYSLIPWNTVDLMTNALSPATPVSQVVAEGALRFEVVVLLDNGNVVPLTAAGPWIDTTWPGITDMQGFSELHMAGTIADPANPKVRALTVAVASVDEKSLRLPNAGNIATVLISPTAGQTPFEAWFGVIDQGGLSACPRPAVAALRVLQRTFPLQ